MLYFAPLQGQVVYAGVQQGHLYSLTLTESVVYRHIIRIGCVGTRLNLRLF